MEQWLKDIINESTHQPSIDEANLQLATSIQELSSRFTSNQLAAANLMLAANIIMTALQNNETPINKLPLDKQLIVMEEAEKIVLAIATKATEIVKYERK